MHTPSPILSFKLVKMIISITYIKMNIATKFLSDAL